jgi:hypothetical protein
MYPYAERLVFGCCSLSANKSKERAIKILKYAESLGIKEFDTAPLYSKGYSELILGEAFKDNKDLNVTTKIGNYDIAKTIIPSSIAIPMNNFIKKFKSESKNISNQINYLKQTTNYDYHFKKQIKSSQKKLNGINIKGILLHEINPYKIDEQIIKNLVIFLRNQNIKNLGYAGYMYPEFFDIEIPKWVKILQLMIPYENNIYEEKILYLLEKYSNIEFRFFNIFSGINPSGFKINYGKKILKDFPNTKIIFQTTSHERLKENFNFFNS